ncbi:Basal body L-ring protein [Cognatishimia activa]|uniref:Flagellar L-ring protein n=3 Tax=Cognatishimia activa TaxID=1715691 RepID=A0A0P1IQJ6_9RHOB|nr:flagellar basal body L-ring protein FlgH [Cognatishimia activa]MEE2945369.1 flagellar basal body L-ring protein FlgH [Pseudomonadota bacterium]CUK25889.1 Basal body L-ring protein [Cognatishimia activa]
MLVGALAVSGCTQNYKETRNPQFSEMDPQLVPEVNRVSVPLPRTEPNRRPKRAEASSLWSRGTSSFFDDQRAQNVGDILTVVINIQDNAQLRNQSERSRSGSQDLNTPGFFGYGSQIDKVLPGVGPDDLPTGGNIVDLGNTSASAGSGSIRRNEAINLRVAALIIKELPNGNFVVAGRQEVKVNSELRELRVAGIIRPEDISTANTVSYDKIAEARITYGGRGQISVVQQPRYGEDFLDVILPY